MGTHRKYVRYDKYSQMYHVGHQRFPCEPFAEIWIYLFQNYSSKVADDVLIEIKNQLKSSTMLKEFVGAAAELCTGAFAVRILKLSLVAAAMETMEEQAKARVGNPYSPEKNRKQYVKMLFVSWAMPKTYEPMYWGMPKVQSTDGQKFDPFGWGQE